MNERIQDVLSIFKDQWVSVFQTILGRDLQLAFPQVEETDPVGRQTILARPALWIMLSWGPSEEQVLAWGCSPRMVSVISNLMIGLDTFGDDISDDDRDAFGEALNQIFSACQVPLKAQMGLDASFREIRWEETGAVDLALGTRELFAIEGFLALEGMEEEGFTLLLPPDFLPAGDDAAEDPGAGGREEQAEAPRAERHSPAAGGDGPRAVSGNIDLLMDVELPVTIRIWSTEMKIIDIMRLGLGSLIELEKMVDDPVDVLVNEKLVARGEIVVYDGNFAIRILDVESRAERIRPLGGE